jgi:hypothetical protein
LNKKLFFVLGAFLLLSLTTPLSLSPPSGGGAGAYDEWGYNYQAHLFSGFYSHYDRHYDPENPDWNDHLDYVYLLMKWNDAWLSNQDRDNDGQLDRHWGYDSYIGSGAWCTNHMRATEGDKQTLTIKWRYFVKIAALDYPVEDYDTWVDGNGDTHLYYEGAEVGILIWGQFAVIQRIYNEQGGPHGVEYKIEPAGFGAAG